MLTWGRTVRIFVCVPPTDMRRGFDGLAATAQTVTRQDPLSGHLFVFFNRRRDRVKILYWDTSGYCLWYKRLEAGQFALSGSGPNQDSVEWDLPQLTLILEGIDLSDSQRHRRYSRPPPAGATQG
jgi:transposase